MSQRSVEGEYEEVVGKKKGGEEKKRGEEGVTYEDIKVYFLRLWEVFFLRNGLIFFFFFVESP